MGRTRNASRQWAAALDRQGNPISPQAASLRRAPPMNASTVVQGPGQLPTSEPLPIRCYRSEPKTWTRNMEAWDLAMLIDLVLKHHDHIEEGLVVELSPDEYARLPGDVSRHFLPIRA